ncbi:I78 family peptidase inhibitor [Bailinhaonella thermotolerans]|nr:I78 family peptidase inhibitor [Bailinhaonella thermotolerans]
MSDEAPEDDLDAYVGLDVRAAENRAGERGWGMVRKLSPGEPMTMEYVPSRINFVLEDDVVRRCWQG